MKILYIDDDPDDAEVFCDAIREIDRQWSCIAISRVEAVLHELDKACPDYVFLDFKMPRLDGRDALVLLKEHTCWARTKVVMYSTFMRETDIEECMKTGAYRCIRKSDRFDTMCKDLKGVLDYGANS